MYLLVFLRAASVTLAVARVCVSVSLHVDSLAEVGLDHAGVGPGCSVVCEFTEEPDSTLDQ